jgi:hypothetical protein
MLLENSSFRATGEGRQGVILPDSEYGIEGFEGTPFHATLTFRDGSFSMYQSDTISTGQYRCEDGTILISYPSGESGRVHFQALTGVLLWNGSSYQNTRQMIQLLIILLIAIIITEMIRRGRL